MKLSFTIIAVLLLNGCIAIPIPPFGNDIGKYGAITINFGYKMASSPQKEEEKNDDAKLYAFTEFSKTLKDK